MAEYLYSLMMIRNGTTVVGVSVPKTIDNRGGTFSSRNEELQE